MFVRVSFCLFCDLKILAVTERHMVENSRASKSKFFIGVLSKFPQLKRSILRIAMSTLLQVYSVDEIYTTYLGMDNFMRWIAAEQLAG